MGTGSGQRGQDAEWEKAATGSPQKPLRHSRQALPPRLKGAIPTPTGKTRPGHPRPHRSVDPTCHPLLALPVPALLAGPQPQGLVLLDDCGLNDLQDLHLLPGDVGAWEGKGVQSVKSGGIKAIMEMQGASDPDAGHARHLPGPSNSHSSPATTLSPLLSTKSSNALRWRAVLGRTTCRGVMS